MGPMKKSKNKLNSEIIFIFHWYSNAHLNCQLKMIFIYDFSPCGLNLVIGQVPIKKWASRVKTNIGGFCTCDSVCNIIVILSVRLQLETRRDLIFPFIHASAFELNLSLSANESIEPINSFLPFTTFPLAHLTYF